MGRNLTNIKERILYYTDNKGLSKERFFEELGITYGSFKGKAKSQALGSDIIERILAKYDDVNPEWLLTGKGEMSRAAQIDHGHNRMPSIITIPSQDLASENIEVVPVKLSAGYVGGGHENSVFMRSLPKFRLPFLNNGTFRCFEVGGHSMARGIQDKDYFVGSFVDNLMNFGEGKIHAVISPEHESLLVKRVFRHNKKKGYVVLRSDNNDEVNTYPDIEMDLKDIREMWSYISLISFKEPEYDMAKFRGILSLNLDCVTL